MVPPHLASDAAYRFRARRSGRRGASEADAARFPTHGLAGRAQTGSQTNERNLMMQVQVNTGNGMQNKETLERWASDFLNDALGRFNQDITRIEVQLTDENRGKGGGADKRCMLEARLNGHEPLAVNHYGDTQDEAFRGATQKLLHALDHALGKLDRREHRDRETIRKSESLTG
jgi:hypothetical protein